MKRIVLILGIMFVGIIILLENSGKRKKQNDFIPDRILEYDDIWWDS